MQLRPNGKATRHKKWSLNGMLNRPSRLGPFFPYPAVPPAEELADIGGTASTVQVALPIVTNDGDGAGPRVAPWVEVQTPVPVAIGQPECCMDHAHFRSTAS